MTNQTKFKVSGGLPCPFCAGKDLEMINVISPDEPDTLHKVVGLVVRCSKCLAQGRAAYLHGWIESVPGAIQAWNERQSPVLVDLTQVLSEVKSDISSAINKLKDLQ